MVKEEVKEVIDVLISELNIIQQDVKSENLDEEYIIFGKNEVYDTTQMRVWAFRNRGDYRIDARGNTIVLDLGNMVNEPVEVAGVKFANSENAYISALYSSADDKSN